jgi:DNA-binding LytR/AlgR family response regulator
LEAFQANALAYLLKPVDPERLATIVDRAAKLCAADQQQAHAELARARTTPLAQVVGRKRDRFVLLNPADILYFTTEGGVLKAKTSAESYLVNYQLAELENGLADSFFRARRSVLVNLTRVKEIRPYFKSSFLLVLGDAPATEIAVAGRQAKLLRQRIPGL